MQGRWKKIQFPENILKDPHYRHFTASYDLSKLELIKSSKDFIFTPLNDKYGVVSCKDDIDYAAIVKKTIGIVDFIEKSLIYVPQELNEGEEMESNSINPMVDSGIETIKRLESLKLDGSGVLVGILDTGINYLNEYLIDGNGNSRIECIFDENVYGGRVELDEDIKVAIGSIYTEEDINKAIKAHRDGKNPYDIVPSKDEDGHGTKMAAIIGGMKKGEVLEGAAVKAKFAIVKLVESGYWKEVLTPTLPVYDIAALLVAIQFLVKYSMKVNKPMVIYIPLGCNFTNHRGDTILENFIEDISINRGIVVVTACGNEGDRQAHTSGNIRVKGEIKEISIYVDPVQEFLATQVWVRKPNIMSFNIISPSGEETGMISAYFNLDRKTKYIFENTQVRTICNIPEASSGDQLIEIYWYNIKSGIWKIRLRGEYILDGRFDAWLPQKGLVFGKTQYINSDSYGTLMSPGSCLSTVNVACYDQTKSYIINSSARSFEDDLLDRVELAAGGINVKVSNLQGDGYSVISGTSVAGAVVAGGCVLLLQWGIVNGNSNDLYSQKIKTLVISGTKKRPGDVYPNPELGYGIFSLIGVFTYMT